MKKRLKKALRVLVIAGLILMSFTTTTFAMEWETIDLEYISITNASFGGVSVFGPNFKAKPPVVIRFKDSKFREQGILRTVGFTEKVKFDVQKYVIFDKKSEQVIVDTLPEGYEGEYFYAPGNYAAISKPGSYWIFANIPDYGDMSFTLDIDVFPSAKPTTSKVLIDGNAVSLQAYNISGSNYFKLRDIALALNETDKRFQVTYEEYIINIIRGKSYTAVGGELEISDNPTEKRAQFVNPRTYLDNEEISVIAYEIDGNNYFKLRDLGEAIDFNVTWDGDNNRILIDTESSYMEE